MNSSIKSIAAQVLGRGLSICTTAAVTIICMTGCSDNEDKGNHRPVVEIPQPTEQEFPAIMHTQADMQFVRDKIDAYSQPWYEAYQSLQGKAKAFLTQATHAIETIYIPGYYEDQSEFATAKAGITNDSHAAYTCALAYSLGTGEKYGRKAIEILDAWAATNTSISNEDDSPLVAAYSMFGLLSAADLLMGHDLWPDEGKTAFRRWLNDVYIPAMAKIKNKANNWGDWGTLAIAASYHLTGNAQAFAGERTRIRERIGAAIMNDGHMPLEVARGNNGPWYTYFALTPMTLSARMVLNISGENLFNHMATNGGSLKKALDYLYYYTQHKDEWPHFDLEVSGPQNGDWPIDLFEAMNDVYNDRYDELVSGFRPVTGGYKKGKATHSAWFYPTLMRCPIVK